MPDLVSEAVEAYALQHTAPESPVRKALSAETHQKTHAPNMLVGPVAGAFLQLLVRLSGARRILELGCFTGYSALAMAEAMPEDGRIVTCDIDAQTTAIAKEFWGRSPHGAKIELRLGPALDTLRTLDGPFDLAFIDADKPPYIDYYEAVLPMMRPGGLIVCDNTLLHGAVLAPKDDVARGMDAFNKRVASDERVTALFLPLRDGLMIAQKK